jgi:hypothetical protein
VYRPVQGVLTTDAAEEGWGAALVLGNLSWTTSGFFLPKDNLTSSNQRESTAVLRALLEFLPTLQAQQIRALMVQSDNMVTVCNLARQSACHTLLHITRAIFSILVKADIRVTPVHIPGIENTLADSLSRLDRSGDYELRTEFFRKGTQDLSVHPTVDCFATSANRKCPRFFAPTPNALSVGAAAIDGLRQPWSKEALPYLHPPISLIPQVLQKIRKEKCTAVMVVPFWPTHSWWTSMEALIKDQTLLGTAKDVLLAGPTTDPAKHKLPPGELLMCLVSCDS